MTVNIKILKEAFRKLLTYYYFDKNELQTRYEVSCFAKGLSNKTEEDRIFNEILQVACGERNDLLNQWLQEIRLCYFPKKVESSLQKQESSHVITNIPQGDALVKRLLVKVQIPVPLLVIDVAWLMLYGYKVDANLHSGCKGNRLDLRQSQSHIRKGNGLFAKYQNQYKKWWKDGLRIANSKLKKKENVSIVNFDIVNCYHSIDFDFEEFEDYFNANFPDLEMTTDPMWDVVKRIYESYWSITNQSGAEPLIGRNAGKRAMPLCLLSAHVLSNWYLTPLDKFITEQNDILYYGRYVDDCMVVLSTKSNSDDVIVSINQELNGLFNRNGKNVTFSFTNNPNDNGKYDHLLNFTLQQDKLYVYRFDCQLPQESIEEFEQEQIERSSEFRFITDEADSSSNTELESVTLVETLDAQEEPGRRFKILSENKYKLAVYLSKLDCRLAKYPSSDKYKKEVEKVFNYFHDYLLIRHYPLWERMFTAFVLSNEIEMVAAFEAKIKHQIENMAVKDALFEDEAEGLQNIKNTLLQHLRQSVLMAKSLRMYVFGDDTIYLDTFMNRMHYNVYPLQEFTDDYKKTGVSSNVYGLKYKRSFFRYRWMPYYVKYYDIVCALSLKNKFDPTVFEKAYKIYWQLNLNIRDKNEWKSFFYNSKLDERDCEINPHFKEEFPPERLTVSVVNMDMEDSDPIDCLKRFGKYDEGKAYMMQGILDKITAIKNTDIFILPELSLPVYELREFCQYSAKNEIAYIAGMEYVKKRNEVYNYIVTCLPITLYGQKDAIPVIRLKNHYAPVEYKEFCWGKNKMIIPKNDKDWQILYHWKGHIFTSYYCFELADVKERSHFFSELDAIYSSVFNRDTYYFNNIAESTARDMHCYFILCNVSHYGDSRVTQPTSNVKMNKMKVKGGNTEDNRCVVLSSCIDVKGLREFQQLDAEQQQNDKRFKFTPSTYDKVKVKKRNNRIILVSDNIFDFDMDAMLSGMIANNMSY